VGEAHDLDSHYGTTALYLDAASIIGSVWLLGLRGWCKGFKRWPLTLMSHFALSSLLFASLHLSCILMGRRCFQFQAYTCSPTSRPIYQMVMYGRFFVNLQLQTWPVIMAVNMVAWCRYQERTAKDMYPYLIATGWAFPALCTGIAWALKGDTRFHFDVGCIFAHGATESGIMTMAYVILLVIGAASMIFMRTGKLPENFSSPNLCEEESIFLRHEKQRSSWSSQSSDNPKVHDKFRTLLLLVVDLLGLLLSIVRLFDSMWGQHDNKLFVEPSGIELVTSVFAVVLVNSLGLVGSCTFALHKEALHLYTTVAQDIQDSYRGFVYNARDFAVYLNNPEPIENVELGVKKVDEIVADILGSTLLGNRRHRMRWYVGCASGKEITTWFVDRGWAASRCEAVQLGAVLLRLGLIYHVHLEHDFEDTGLFYRVRQRQPSASQAETDRGITRSWSEPWSAQGPFRQLENSSRRGVL